MRDVVVPVTRAEFGVFVLRHIGRRVSQRLHQPQANHISRRFVGRHAAAHIAHRRLNAAHDDLGGVEQRAVPVEGDQVEVQWLL